ncbi:unnamed protein product [Hydatigera taeniaeformis]|uniref:Uncharacterized protein n=1 Tax=Hydatigena taeniaeformis TaxID=6205 RepID=A0A0R3WLC5_HYDTA|nr:unnamed protein product [Hydatigera taeniaeformis]
MPQGTLGFGDEIAALLPFVIHCPVSRSPWYLHNTIPSEASSLRSTHTLRQNRHFSVLHPYFRPFHSLLLLIQKNPFHYQLQGLYPPLLPPPPASLASPNHHCNTAGLEVLRTQAHRNAANFKLSSPTPSQPSSHNVAHPRCQPSRHLDW